MSDHWSRIEHMSETVGGAGTDESAPGPAPELEPTGDPALDSVFARLAEDVAELNDHDLTALVRLDAPSTGLHAAARNLELLRRRLAVFDSHYVAAVEVGDEPARYARPSTAVFLREQLRLSGGEAKRRVDLAHADHPGRGVHRGSPARPAAALAAAVTAGVVSADHARTIMETITKLPTPVRRGVRPRGRAGDGPSRGQGHPGRPGSPRPGGDGPGRPRRDPARHRPRPPAAGPAVVEETRAGRIHPASRPRPGNRRSRPGRAGRLVQTRPRHPGRAGRGPGQQGRPPPPGPDARRLRRRPQSHPQLRGPAGLWWDSRGHRLAHRRPGAAQPVRPSRLRTRHPAPRRRRPPRRRPEPSSTC